MRPVEPGTLRRQRGMGLIEQFICLAVLGLLASVALPALHGMLARGRVAAAHMDFQAGLHYARSLAATENVRVVFCPTRDGRRCSSETRWDGGWLLGPDADRDDQPDGTPLRVTLRQADGVLIRSSEGRPQVIFQPDGSASGSNLTLLFCGDRAQALSLVVAGSGRIRGAPASPLQAASCLTGA